PVLWPALGGPTAMPRTLYALLVGIDQYPAPLSRLYGCVNDIDAIGVTLHERVAADRDFRLDARVLKDAEATRRAVIAGFRKHLARAGPDDVALFYFSGHGSQQQSPPELWAVEPDHLDETLVCYDSRLAGQGGWDLADKELARLIAEAAEKGAHVAVVLDCCHSGSGTRNLDLEETAVRRAPTDLRRRPFATFLAEAGRDTRSPAPSPSGWGTVGGARH